MQVLARKGCPHWPKQSSKASLSPATLMCHDKAAGIMGVWSEPCRPPPPHKEEGPGIVCHVPQWRLEEGLGLREEWMRGEQIGEGILPVSTAVSPSAHLGVPGFPSSMLPESWPLQSLLALDITTTVSSLANTVAPLSPLYLSRKWLGLQSCTPLCTQGGLWLDGHTHLVTFPGYADYLGQPLGWSIQTQLL